MEIDVKSPAFTASDRQRNRELAQLAAQAARQTALAFIGAGWRESEVALAFADAFDEYCLFLAQKPGADRQAANGNRASKGCAAN